MELKNTHEVLAESAFKKESTDASTHVISTKVTQQIKDDISKICAMNGTTVSKFLRNTCENIVKEYAPAQD